MSIRNYFVRLFATASLLIAALAMTRTATAQVFFPNPPCGAIMVINNTLCTAQLNFITAPPGVWPPAFPVPAGAAIPLPVPMPGVTINGIISMGGVFYPVNPPPPPPFMACNPWDFWIGNVTLGPPPGCCFDICFDPRACTITLWPSAWLPPCNP